MFWSLLLLFLSLTAAARAQGDRDSLAAATTDPLTVQTAGGNSLAAVEQVWDAANTAYINSDYHRAIDAYRQLILRGYASDKLYYNLANAYFKVGRYGKAILYYNRALRLAPGDADIRYNLDVANTFTKDKIAVVPGEQGWELLEKAGRKRGFLMSGGEVNTERMARILLDEYRAGKLGRFTLELPEENA